MSWQDIVIGLCNFVTFFGLILSIKSPKKPTLATSVVTASAVTIVAITLGTLSLWIAVISTGLIAGGWWILTWQNLTMKK